MIEVGYKAAEERSGYYYGPITTPLNPWSVVLYTQNGLVSLESSSWEMREETIDWQRKLGKDSNNEPEVVEIPPHLEYQLCISREVERAEVTYKRPDKQIDYIKLKKVESDPLDPTSCFVIDPLLVGMDGIFTINGHYASTNSYEEPKSFAPVVIFTKNGFVALKPISDDVLKQPNHYYSKTPPINACRKGTDNHVSLHFEDRDANHMRAYAVLRGIETQLKLIGNASPQNATFFVPRYIAEGYGFTFYAIDAEGNKSKEFALSNDTPTAKIIPACQE